MAITIDEAVDSQQGALGDGAREELRYKARGSADGDAIRRAVWYNAPSYHNGLVKKSVDADPIFVDEGRPEKCFWDARVHYGRRRSEPDTGEARMDFEVGGGTQHITQSLETVGAYAAPGKTPLNTGGAIGLTREGEVEGVDIEVPTFSWTETHYLDDDQVTMAYVDALFRLYAHVNTLYFRKFAPGEVLFVGARGASRTDSQEGDWEVQFSFKASPNRDDIYVNGIGPIRKRGWEYLWVYYEKREDADTGFTVPRPHSVYVEGVYNWGDFRVLGIPPPLA